MKKLAVLILLLTCSVVLCDDLPEGWKLTPIGKPQCVLTDGDTIWVGSPGVVLEHSTVTGEETRHYLVGDKPLNPVAITTYQDQVLFGSDRNLFAFDKDTRKWSLMKEFEEGNVTHILPDGEDLWLIVQESFCDCGVAYVVQQREDTWKTEQLPCHYVNHDAIVTDSHIWCSAELYAEPTMLFRITKGNLQSELLTIRDFRSSNKIDFIKLNTRTLSSDCPTVDFPPEGLDYRNDLYTFDHTRFSSKENKVALMADRNFELNPSDLSLKKAEDFHSIIHDRSLHEFYTNEGLILKVTDKELELMNKFTIWDKYFSKFLPATSGSIFIKSGQNMFEYLAKQEYRGLIVVEPESLKKRTPFSSKTVNSMPNNRSAGLISYEIIDPRILVDYITGFTRLGDTYYFSTDKVLYEIPAKDIDKVLHKKSFDPLDISGDQCCWDEMDSPTGYNLNAVDMHSKDYAIAVGDFGTILMWDGLSWKNLDPPFEMSVYDLLYPDRKHDLIDVEILSNEQYLVSTNKATFLWNGTNWNTAEHGQVEVSVINFPFQHKFADDHHYWEIESRYSEDFCADSKCTTYATLKDGYKTMYSFSLQDFQANDVDFVNPNEGWIVGSDGIILHYQADTIPQFVEIRPCTEEDMREICLDYRILEPGTEITILTNDLCKAVTGDVREVSDILSSGQGNFIPTPQCMPEIDEWFSYYCLINSNVNSFQEIELAEIHDAKLSSELHKIISKEESYKGHYYRWNSRYYGNENETESISYFSYPNGNEIIYIVDYNHLRQVYMIKEQQAYQLTVDGHCGGNCNAFMLNNEFFISLFLGSCGGGCGGRVIYIRVSP